jgi:pentatricopeptide repeat protein
MLLSFGAVGPPEGTNEAASLRAGSGDPSSIAAAGQPSDSRRIIAEGTNRTASSSPVSSLESFRKVRKAVLEHLRHDGDFHRARMLITGMVEYISNARAHGVGSGGQGFHGGGFKTTATTTTTTTVAAATTALVQQSWWQQLPLDDRRAISETVDEAFQAFFARAFATPPVGRSGWERVAMGIDLLQLHLSSTEELEAPYHTIPKGVLVHALSAVTCLLERPVPRGMNTWNGGGARKGNGGGAVDTSAVVNPDTAYRLLQRLVTGVGVRNFHVKKNHKGDHPVGRSSTPAVLYEQDFNRVLNVYSNLGKMDMAHRVVALQERSPHAPSLSHVTYSILVKGYGKLGDWNSIDVVLQRAAASKIAPDTILFNSVMDAYINCNQLGKARAVFNAMAKRLNRGNPDRNVVDEDNSKIGGRVDGFPFARNDCPAPSVRSYNILLKGLARGGLWHEAQELAFDMKESFGLWDHVTTNTLVQAAVAAGEFGAAKEIIEAHTIEWNASKESNAGGRTNRRGSREHPNVDAYTTLMDGYVKSGNLELALGLLSLMKERRVEPNEYHYSCLIGGLTRQNRIDQAQKMLTFVKLNLGIPRYCQTVLYNALISGLVYQDRVKSGSHDHDRNIDEAIAVFRDMIHEKVMPDVNTVAVILDGFGRCSRPRVHEAVTLVNKLEAEGVIPKNNVKVSTALLRVFAAAEDLDNAVSRFQKILDPDVAAINAFIDASCRCGNDQMANETFDLYFGGKDNRQRPNVITYSTLIGAALRQRTFVGLKSARILYEEMKFRRHIFPDKPLIDM